MTHPPSRPNLVDTFACSETGSRGPAHGDQFLVAELKRAARVHHASQSALEDSRHFGLNQAHVLLVADGGRRAAGDVASSLVVDEVMESILHAIPWTPDLNIEREADLRQELKQTFVRCNSQLDALRDTSRDEPEMAAASTMAFVRWPNLFVVHAGDSRAYLIRDGEVHQLTRDHTFAQRMVDDGRLEEDDAETSRFASMLWNAVGGSHQVVPELTAKQLRAGDTLLLCSAGLVSRLSDGAVLSLVEDAKDAQSACESLVGTVAAINKQDNVTVAMARFQGEVGVESASDSGAPELLAGRAAEIPSKPAASVVAPATRNREVGA